MRWILLNVLSKLTKRHLKLNRKRTIVSIIGIALSTALIFAVSIAVLSFQDLAIRAAYETSGKHEVQFTDVQFNNVKYIEENSNTKDVMYSKLIGYSKLDVDEKASKQNIQITAYDQKAFENYPSALLEGELPKSNSEIVISDNINEKIGTNYKVGDKITLNPTLENGKATTKTYTITGILDPTYTERGYADSFAAFTFLDKSDLTSSDAVDVGVTFNNRSQIKESVKEMASAIGATSENYDYNNTLLVWTGNSSSSTVNDFLYAIAAFVIVLIIIGSVAVIYNAFAISVNERKKQFGILASVGATPKQIKKMVFKESGIMGLYGIPLGLLIGYLGMLITFQFINSFIFASVINIGDFSFNVVISPVILAITVALVIVTILISAYIPAKKASKVAPIEAIRLTNDIKITGKKVKTSKLTKKLFGIEGAIALKNLKRNRKRYRTTIFSLFISIVLFISFSTIILYSFDLSDQRLGKADYDFYFSISGVSDTEQYDTLNNAAKLGGGGEYHIYRRLDSTTENALNSEYTDKVNVNYVNISVLEMQDSDFEEYAKEVGIDTSTLSNDGANGILINKTDYKKDYYKPLNITANTNLNMQAYTEDGDAKDITINVAAVTDKLPAFTAYLEKEVYLAVPQKSMNNILAKNKGLNISGYITFLKASDYETYAKNIEEFQKTNNTGSFSYTDIKDMLKSMQQMKLFVSIFLYGFITIITLIGVTNVFNTINTNIQLRRKEFAMLKSVGLTPKGFNKMMYYESIFYGLKALLYGLPVGIGLSFLMYYVFGGVGAFDFILPWKAIIICIVGVFVIVFMTMLYAGSKIKKENIMDALVNDII